MGRGCYEVLKEQHNQLEVLMFKYCTKITEWEEWQRDYQYGLILILPPPEVSQEIDRLRQSFDPKAYAICPTHITISDPLGREMTPELDAEIADILSQIQPFRLHYLAPAASHEYPGVACPIKPQDPVDNLKEHLHRAAIFKGKVYHRRGIPAHMTIAEFVTIAESWQILEEIIDHAPRGSFLFDRLYLIIPDQNFHFQGMKTYSLGR